VKRLNYAALRTLQVLVRLFSFGLAAIVIVVGGIWLAGGALVEGIYIAEAVENLLKDAESQPVDAPFWLLTIQKDVAQCRQFC
jgi:hypothetical protein